MENLQNIRIAVDAIVFGYKNNGLYALLIEQQFGTSDKYWALPGGLVQNEESLSDAVIRELHEETNVELTFMEQLYTFGDDIRRDSRNRVISVAYYALVDASNLEIKADRICRLASARFLNERNGRNRSSCNIGSWTFIEFHRF